MKDILRARVEEAKQAALAVLLHNMHGPYHALPRTAGWGYPEPYTRDLMISTLGILASGNRELLGALRRVFVTLAEHQTARGHIPSLAHDPTDLGASDTTPLFLMALALYRRATGEHDFLHEAAQKALTWMEYQSPGDDVIVGQLPTSDWRDEQWVLGFGLFVNAVVFTYLRLFGLHERADQLRGHLQRLALAADDETAVAEQPYYALWAYKIYDSERFDLLGNSLAVIAGLLSPARERLLIPWVERACTAMRARGELALDLPPNCFPFIQPGDADWLPRYAQLNRPGEYHNGGVWPFVTGFYIVAALAAGFPEVAEAKLAALTDLVRLSVDPALPFGFNEWFRAQDGTPQGQDWQTWTAAMYLYAAACVERGQALFLHDLREPPARAA